MKFTFREFYRDDPYLRVWFCDQQRWPWAAFMHTPERGTVCDPLPDMLHFNDDHNYGRYLRPSPALLKALKRVLEEP